MHTHARTQSENRDKDLRHMALYDLNTELQKSDFKLDESSQRQLAEVVLKLLDDTSSDVQGMAVKWCVFALRLHV